jgi:hypothetical protein
MAPLAPSTPAPCDSGGSLGNHLTSLPHSCQRLHRQL